MISFTTGLESGITDVFSHDYAKVDSNDSLPLEKTLVFRNVIRHIKLVCNKAKNN